MADSASYAPVSPSVPRPVRRVAKDDVYEGVAILMLSRLPLFRRDPQHPPRFHGGHVMGPETLTLVWDV